MGYPLAGIRVLDLSRVLAGPWASQTLADLGAEVIKIERPGVGDETRDWGPPFVEGADGAQESAYFLCVNRGKQSVAVDITQPAGQAIIRDLAMTCDIVIENFKVGGLVKYGLDVASLRKLNPRLICCSVTGFGQDGPYANRAGYDYMLQGMGGIMSVTGAPDADGGMPTKIGVALTDVITGLYSCIGILAALHRRDETGQGDYVDMSLLDVSVAMLANQSMNYLASGKPPERMGNAHPNIVPYQLFHTADGHMILAVGNDGQFARFCKAAALDELADDPRYKTNRDRVANRAALVALIETRTRTRTTQNWTDALDKVAVPCSPINRIDQVFANPQVVARGMEQSLPHSALGTVPSVKTPLVFADATVGATQGPPTLGEHNTAVLSQLLGYSEDHIALLSQAKVIGK